MKFKLFFLLLAGAITFSFTIHAQSWLWTGNSINTTEWFGALNGSTIPLNLEHRGTLDINFLNGTGPSFNRMIIRGTGAGAQSGFVGINTTNPRQLLDIWRAGNVPQLRLTSGFAPLRSTDFIATADGHLLIQPQYELPSGALNQRNVGIGDFITFNTSPAAKLEVFDTDNPLVRITRVLNTIYTNLEVNVAGNFRIQPTGGNVGINMPGTAGPTAHLAVAGATGINFNPGLTDVGPGFFCLRYSQLDNDPRLLLTIPPTGACHITGFSLATLVPVRRLP